MKIFEVKKIIIKLLLKTNIGFKIVFQIKKLLGRIPKPNYNFPNSISIEISSICNLSCSHCPPHNFKYKNNHRKYGVIDIELFNRLMDEIDNSGEHRLALHKDGEPLLHPKIIEILERVKRNKNHSVYLSTNGHYLTKEIGEAIIKNKIDIINFSIGAANKSFYEKVRGKGFDKVQNNIHQFLEQIKEASWKPRIIAQIIDLQEYKEMKNEIKEFKKYWGKNIVEVEVYGKLTWGVLESNAIKIKRYPCFSLWNNIFVNSDGNVSPCCMDWKQELIIGNSQQESIEKIWKGDSLKKLRDYHIKGKENELSLCEKCNYWSTVPKILSYEIGN